MNVVNEEMRGGAVVAVFVQFGDVVKRFEWDHSYRCDVTLSRIVADGWLEQVTRVEAMREQRRRGIKRCPHYEWVRMGGPDAAQRFCVREFEHAGRCAYMTGKGSKR